MNNVNKRQQAQEAHKQKQGKAEMEEHPEMNHIAMTHTCIECGRDDCEVACEDGTCKIVRKA